MLSMDALGGDMSDDRIISSDSQNGDGRDRALRPLSFNDFVGQKSVLENLKVYVEGLSLIHISEPTRPY